MFIFIFTANNFDLTHVQSPVLSIPLIIFIKSPATSLTQPSTLTVMIACLSLLHIDVPHLSPASHTHLTCLNYRSWTCPSLAFINGPHLFLFHFTQLYEFASGRGHMDHYYRYSSSSDGPPAAVHPFYLTVTTRRKHCCLCRNLFSSATVDVLLASG